MLRIGDKAPEFELKLHNGLRFRLADYLGKRNVVLYFYPKKFPFAGAEAGLFADQVDSIRTLGSEIVGINNDSTENHRQIAKSVNIAFALASDPTLEVCRNYRALWLNGLAIRRITYIIDKRGIVRGMAHHELLVQQHWNHVVRTLQELNEDEQIRTFNRKAWNL